MPGAGSQAVNGGFYLKRYNTQNSFYQHELEAVGTELRVQNNDSDMKTLKGSLNTSELDTHEGQSFSPLSILLPRLCGLKFLKPKTSFYLKKKRMN